MEMIFVLLFLGLTCGVCVRLFAASYMARVHAREDSHIQELITSAGEILEGTDGTVQNFLALMPDGVADQDSICYYLYTDSSLSSFFHKGGSRFMKEKNHLFSATGIPSLFLIFGVLMLVILSLLGYGTSRQDLRASSLSLEQTSAYYNACSEAADFYSDLVQTLEGFQAQVKSESSYYKLVSDYLNSQENVKWDSEEHTAEYMNAFSDTQSLAVKVSVFWTDRTADSTASDTVASDTAASDRTVTNNAGLDVASSNIAGILSWNTVVTADWNPDNSQSVYKGE